MTGQKFYDELTKLHDKLDRKLRQEYGTVQSLEYALDFKCLNDCKSSNNMKRCYRHLKLYHCYHSVAKLKSFQDYCCKQMFI